MRSISLVAIGLAAFFMFAANGAALAKPQPDAKETPEKLPERAVGRLGALAYSHESVVTASDFSRGGRFLVTGSYGGFHVWDTTTGKVQWQGRFDMDDYEKGVRHLQRVLAVRFLDSDRKILVVAQSGYALWDVARAKRDLTCTWTRGRVPWRPFPATATGSRPPMKRAKSLSTTSSNENAWT